VENLRICNTGISNFVVLQEVPATFGSLVLLGLLSLLELIGLFDNWRENGCQGYSECKGYYFLSAFRIIGIVLMLWLLGLSLGYWG
jgi:hypothetical protein